MPSTAAPVASPVPGAGAASSVAGVTQTVPTPAVFSVPGVSGVATAAQVAPILAAAQAALASQVNLSPQAQQAIKAEAFAQLVAQLVQQIQGSNVQQPANWPAGGVTPQWQALLQALVQQASAGQPLPQQLVSAQSWPSALVQTVLQNLGAGAQPAPSPQVPAQPPPSLAAQLPAAAGNAVPPGSGPAGMLRPALPPLQNWLVQQGVLQGPDGDRAFTLTLRVPVAWAQAQSVLGQALGAQPAASPALLGGGSGPLGAGSALGALLLPYGSSVQPLANTSFGLVLQPQGLPAAQAQAMRTSAVLQLEFQPLPNAAASAAQQSVAAALLPAGMLPQEAYQALLARGGDPWLHMAQQQASGQLPRERQHHGEGQQCDRAGCQYQGRAECAQPFCAEMNSIWAADRAGRR